MWSPGPQIKSFDADGWAKFQGSGVGRGAEVLRRLQRWQFIRDQRCGLARRFGNPSDLSAPQIFDSHEEFALFHASPH